MMMKIMMKRKKLLIADEEQCIGCSKDTKKLDTYKASIIRLRLTSIVDLSSELRCSRQHYEDRESLLRISMLGNVKILTRPNEGSFSHENTSSNHEYILHNLGYAT
ncbi:uncharacterized protein OCT59_000446 [Rhizophagus irregularis]|uniref:uncharacterized protein n=1 Tax=Rhizophagus irregularis TaxID=588596 RepID=UPI0033333A00|nr:hypothetical protein OCT59_000446 [Rhizophagus irregularis]